jgi:hypothetical protein
MPLEIWMEIVMNSDRMYLGPMVLAAGVLVLGSHAQAQSVSGQIATQQVVINAAIPQVCTITLSGPSSGATFSGGTATVSPGNTSATTTIGLVSITEQCNDKNGYTISIKDSNSASLVGSAGNTDVLTYSIIYDATGTPVTATPTAGNNVIFTAPKKATATKQVMASITSPGNSAADIYTDTLTFTMTTK